MSYVDLPRIHFFGQFYADVSTIDNTIGNYDPAVQLQSTDPNAPGYVSWNPFGTHNFAFRNCTVKSAMGSDGTVYETSAADPVVGAVVESAGEKFPVNSPTCVYYSYPAKMVDLDADQQMVSQIWGFQVRITTPSGAEVAGQMSVTSLADIWPRCSSLQHSAAYCAIYQSVLTNLTWTHVERSPLLAQLQAISGTELSIKFIVDAYNTDKTSATFGVGRVAGTIGPAAAGEPTRFLAARRLTSASGQFGPTPVKVDAARSRLILDLGNTVPSVHTAGQPKFVLNSSYPSLLVAVQKQALPFGLLQHSTPGAAVPTLDAAAGFTSLGIVECSESQYESTAGIVELALTAEQLALISQSRLALFAPAPAGIPVPSVIEHLEGLYVNAENPVFRIYPGTAVQATALVATQWGHPKAGLALDVTLVPNNDWNNLPAAALQINGQSLPVSVTTGPDGRAPIQFTALDPIPKPPQRQYIDSQIYSVGGPWQQYGQVGLGSGAAISVMVWNTVPAVTNPTWSDVQPILEYYTRVYPYMKTAVDISDYATIMQFDPFQIRYIIQYVPEVDPHFMPVSRDLSPPKRDMLIAWLNNPVK